jgi:hypothetical protein
VGAGSLLTLLLVIKEPLATRAVAVSITYGADLIIAAYILVVVAAVIFTVRRRTSAAKTVILPSAWPSSVTSLRPLSLRCRPPATTETRSPPGSPSPPGSSCRWCTRRCGGGSATRLLRAGASALLGTPDSADNR